MVQNKTAAMICRTTPARKALYREVAAAEGLRLSDWLRRLADRRVAEIAHQQAA